MNIGERIYNLRQDKNMTQQELADIMYVTDKTISSWETNRTEPSLESIIKISEIFECSVGYLIYGNTTKNDIETEIKIKLTNEEFKSLQEVMENDAKYLNEQTQIDTYYQPINRKFISKSDLKNGTIINEWLRIGKRGNKKILNYKNWHDSTYCDEYEVEIDNVDNLEKIFTVIGLEKLIVVDKTRKVYLYKDKYEVALDEVAGLGYFVEIEVKKYEKSAIDEYDLLINLAKKLRLNLDNIDKRGYPYQLLDGIK